MTPDDVDNEVDVEAARAELARRWRAVSLDEAARAEQAHIARAPRPRPRPKEDTR